MLGCTEFGKFAIASFGLLAKRFYHFDGPQPFSREFALLLCLEEDAVGIIVVLGFHQVA